LWAVQQCRAAGFEPDVRFEAADLTTHVRLVASGHAVGMLPDLIWGDEPSPLTIAELPGSPVREVFTAIRTSSHAHGSVELVRSALREAFTAHRRIAP
ncbi:MAG: LysR substrate-binding domain-containing protein, partial [Microbacterium sp.]